MELWWGSLVEACEKFALTGLFFGAAALLIKRARLLERFRPFSREFRLNILYYLMNVIAIGPLVVLAIDHISRFTHAHLALVTPDFYASWPVLLTLLWAVLLSDFIGYWRHRMMHGRMLWPAHAIHHSDREMCWLSLERFHPVNYLIAAFCNIMALSMLGLPVWAVGLNSLIRHYYGYWIHADLPFTYGPLKKVFVSPMMHRWHHTRDMDAIGRNYATVFAFHDVAFGSFYLPEGRELRLGIEDKGFPDDIGRQTLWPFKVWARRLRRRWGRMKGVS